MTDGTDPREYESNPVEPSECNHYFREFGDLVHGSEVWCSNCETVLGRIEIDPEWREAPSERASKRAAGVRA